jgi:iron complex outermembrane receptor protein
MKKISILLVALFTLLSAQITYGQVTGKVIGDDSPLIGVSVIEKGTSNGATTDAEGAFSINVKSVPTVLVFSYVGFSNKEIEITADNAVVEVNLSAGIGLDEIVVTGSRTAPRSSTNTPLPIDVVSAKELLATGQNSFDKALTYKIPSFNSVNTPVNDATSLLDPYEIRNMGPSRTLILINGKRKNTSALLYTQTSPGRGETGADISAIPQSAIKRVEILRDGASAQYGSDAIAGVMNIILKDDANYGSVTLNTGITAAGDGESYGISINNGVSLNGKGFVNYTVDLSKRELANRPGLEVDAAAEAGDFGADLADVEAFLNKYPDANNVNGSPETTASKFLINLGYDLGESSQLYANAAYVYKKVNSFANYRTPYWRTEAAFPYLADFFPNGDNGEYIGYVPTFDGDLNDYNGTIGVRNETNGWITDVSFTVGGNKQTYYVTNSHNRSTVLNEDGATFKYQQNSPLAFDVGGTSFTHSVGNIDITRRLSDMVGFAFGSEFRSETFEVIAGSESSYEGGGPDSFAGNDPRNSGKFNRYNFGGYVDFAFDFTDDFLVNATARLENYSDFGSAFVWKVSSRYKLADDKVTLRGSVSTGFRAPLLHQIYTQKAQYSFVPGQGIQVGGLINNVSREARLLGLPSLDAEKSTNITVGLGTRVNDNLSITVDYFNIAVKDRIILSTEIGASADGNTPLDDILTANNLSDLSFFVNALDTRTSGIDLVANYKGLEVGGGKMGVNLSGNYMIQNERVGDVKNPTLVSEAGQTVSNGTQEALFFTSKLF